MFSLDALKLLFDALKELWVKADEIKDAGQNQRREIAETCGYIADALVEKRDQFLSGMGFARIEVPAHMKAMAKLLEGKLPENIEYDYGTILRAAAAAVREIEGMHASDFSKLERTEQDALIEPINTAIGEFRALSKTLHLAP